MMKKIHYTTFFIILFLLSMENFAANLTLKSPAFTNNALIPQQYTCQGRNSSPALFWQNPPAGTRSFALIVDDPDAPAGNWVHWVLFNIPADALSIFEAAQPSLGAVSGQNSWGKIGYSGPCPASGTHHYFFRLFALNKVLDLNSSANKQQLFDAMQNHILATSELIGVYKKNSVNPKP